MDNHLISFLGASNYESCIYQYKGKCSRPTPYIQIAMIELLEELAVPQSRVSIFLTQKAKEKNWEAPNGLAVLFRTRFPHIPVSPIPIPDGSTPDELWNIFTIVFNQLREEETVFYDITHSFRSLPLFGVALLSYARILKQISVGGIYYGAIEALGPVQKIKELPEDQRIAPLFDLTSVYTLMEWGTAVHLFLRTGRAEELAEMVRTGLKPFLSAPGKLNLEDIGAQKLADKLKQISLDLLTNRGEEIRQGETFNQIHRVFSDLQGKELNLKPMEPLLAQIGEKIGGFRYNDIRNNYRAVEWCIQHGWIQQGITQLQETIITHMLELLQEIPKDCSEKEKISKREIVSSVFHAKNNPAAQQIYEDCLKKNPHLAKRVLDHPFCEVAALPFNKLRDYRNDINHGGFVEKNTAPKFQSRLHEAFEELKKRYKDTFREDLY